MRRRKSAVSALGVGVSLASGAGLVGCSMPNSSNPTLSITGARVSGDRASLSMQLDNPSGMDVTINSIDWSLVYGPLPVAEGTWRLGVPLPSGETYRFTEQVTFDGPVLDPTADTVELSGTMDVSTEGDTGEMSLKGASFVSESKIR